MRPVDLPQRINLCRSNHQSALPSPAESQELLSLESYVALQSRGQAIAPPADARLQAATERGAARFRQRLGQLDLAPPLRRAASLRWPRCEPTTPRPGRASIPT